MKRPARPILLRARATPARAPRSAQVRLPEAVLPAPRPHFHPWHDIPTGPDAPDVVTAVIEIPSNERNKYELDKALGVFKLDRVLHSAVHYPGDYGFLPRTLGDDGDPLDVLVLTTIPVFTGCLVECRPIGVFHLIDKGAKDEKILAVPTGDPYATGWTDLGHVPPHALKEIEHFFMVYKDLEKVRTESRGFEGADAARRMIREAAAHYETKFGAAA